MAYTTIDDPSAHFQIAEWTGNDSSRSITFDGNSNMQPDWMWFKNHTELSRDHQLQDSSRGVTKTLQSNGTSGESTLSNLLTSFDSDGFSLGNNALVNEGAATIVGWGWKANGGTTTTNSAGANGADHESVYQANDTAGFSIVTYTSDNASGDTVIKHGLSTAPTFMIHKARNADSTIWWTYHKELGNSGYMHLESTNANQTGSSNVWRNTAPTSSVFKVGLTSVAPADGRTMIAYCFAPIQGYSKFGKYTGNGSADGTFVYTGFKPAWFLCKQYNATRSWTLIDNKRPEINSNDTKAIIPNENNAAENIDADFLSNGLKIRQNHTAINESGGSYIFMAFAESPLVGSDGTPTTAR